MQVLEALDPARMMRMALLTLIGMLAIFLEITPLGLEASARPSPDLLLCVVAYWSIRRPGSAPAVLIFLLGLELLLSLLCLLAYLLFYLDLKNLIW